MKLYFTFEDNQQNGPFSLKELAERKISKNTPVWKEGMPAWTKAGELEELKQLLPVVPPAFTANPNAQSFTPGSAVKAPDAERSFFKMSRSAGWMALIIVIVALFGFIVYKKQDKPARPAEITAVPVTPVVTETPVIRDEPVVKDTKVELIKKEKQNPGHYLLAHTTMRKNLVGEKVFEGTITNRASMAIYKDVVLEVQFLSKTDGKIGSEKFTVYEIIPPRQKVKFKFKSGGHSGTKGFKAGVIDANTVE